MDIKSLTRDAAVVKKALKQVDQTIVAAQDCKIYVPTRFAERKLAVISNEIRIVGIYAIVVGNNYGVSSACAMMQITPGSTSIVTVEGDDYYEFTFFKGAVVCPNCNLVKEDTLVYNIYDEVIAKGHIPWYLSYIDIGKIFTTSSYHGGLSLGPTNIPIEILAASTARTKEDRTIYYRHSIDNLEGKDNSVKIPFRNVIYGATNATARLTGAYFDDGLTSALVNPSESTEGVETLLRR
jgi:hypothetical protein